MWYLVGVVRQVGDGGGQTALGGQQVGILAHLLSQQDANSSGTRALGLLHCTPQHHHLLHQILRDGNAEHISTTKDPSCIYRLYFGQLGATQQAENTKSGHFFFVLFLRFHLS